VEINIILFVANNKAGFNYGEGGNQIAQPL
jgi:hypothetical protein